MKYNALTALTAKSLPPGKHADGQGLWLIKSRKQAGKWILRLTVSGKRREMGLGRWPDVSLAEARETAAAARRKLRSGVDPIESRASERRKPARLTIKQAVQGCFEAKQAELKNDGAAGRWRSPLDKHVLPKIGDMAIEDLDQHQLKAVLDPIWHTKPEAARKAANRVNLTLKFAAAMGLDVDLQAVMKTRALLGKQRHESTHIPALPYRDLPAFYTMLTDRTHQTACLALRFLILTCTRTSEVRLARYDEIEDDLWVIPAQRTKTGVEHRVPLVPVVQELVKQTRIGNPHPHLFTTVRANPLSDAAMSKFMREEGYEARPHGFRATFRTWVEEQTDAPFEVKEAVLGHAVDKGAVAAYQRSDRLEKRRALMQRWAAYCSTA